MYILVNKLVREARSGHRHWFGGIEKERARSACIPSIIAIIVVKWPPAIVITRVIAEIEEVLPAIVCIVSGLLSIERMIEIGSCIGSTWC